MKKVRRYIRILKIIAPEYLLGIVGVIFLVFLFTLAKFFYRPPLPNPTPLSVISPEYSGLSLSARAVDVYDLAEKREIYSINGDAQLPLASLTKIMMAVTALSLLPENTVVTINPQALEVEGNSGLFGNERWSLKDLLGLTLLESSNDGATAVALAADAAGQGIVSDNFGQGPFVDAMNRKARELGLSQTYFLNPTGLDENQFVSGAYGSARDVATLFSYALNTYPSIFDVTRYDSGSFASLGSLTHTVKNTDIVVDKISSLLGSKTGYTDLAGGNLAIAFDAGPNHPIVISVLGSTEQGRFDDTLKLVAATLEYLKTN